MEKTVTSRYIRVNTVEQERSAEKTRRIIAIILLCLMSMDFQTRFFYFAFALFGVLILIRRSKFVFPQAVIPAFILSVAMCAFSPSTKGWLLALVRPFAYPFCVIAGYNLISTENDKHPEKQIVGIIIALAFGAYFHYMLNMIYNWGKTVDRNTIDFWTKSVLAATGQSTLAALMIGVSIPMLFSENRKGLKFLFAVILLSILYYNLMLGGRTVFVLTIILLVLNIVVEWIKNRSGNTRIYIFLSLFFFSIIVYFIIRFNLFGIQNIFYESNFFTRFFSGTQEDSITGDSRMKYKLLYLQKMIWHPFGGNDLHRAVGNHYAHDLLLDTYSDSSVFAFSAILFMLINCIVKTVRIYRNKETDSWAKKLLVNVIITFCMMFFMEPIFDGMPWLFASFCVIYGAIIRIEEYLINRMFAGERKCAYLK